MQRCSPLRIVSLRIGFLAHAGIFEWPKDGRKAWHIHGIENSRHNYSSSKRRSDDKKPLYMEENQVKTLRCHDCTQAASSDMLSICTMSYQSATYVLACHNVLEDLAVNHCQAFRS